MSEGRYRRRGVVWAIIKQVAKMAPRRSATPPTPPQRPEMSPQEIRKSITKLERRIDDLKRFDPSKVTKRFNIPEVVALQASIDEAR